MDVTGGLADAVSKITAALPGVESSVAADLAAARDAVQAEIEQVAAQGQGLVMSLQVAGSKLLGAASVAELVPKILGAQDVMALLERGITFTIQLGPKPLDTRAAR